MGVLALLVILGMLSRTSETRPDFIPGGQHSSRSLSSQLKPHSDSGGRVSNDSAPDGQHYEACVKEAVLIHIVFNF